MLNESKVIPLIRILEYHIATNSVCILYSRETDDNFVVNTKIIKNTEILRNAIPRNVRERFEHRCLSQTLSATNSISNYTFFST